MAERKRVPPAPRRPGRYVCTAWCTVCDTTWEAKNAFLVGERHAAHTGHQVHVERTFYTIFNPPELS